MFHKLVLCESVFQSSRGGSAVKHTRYSSSGPRFGSKHPHGSSQPPITPVPGDPMPSSGLLEHCTQVVHIQACRQNTSAHKKSLKALCACEALSSLFLEAKTQDASNVYANQLSFLLSSILASATAWYISLRDLYCFKMVISQPA